MTAPHHSASKPDAGRERRDSGRGHEELNEEFIELLNELRVALAGVAVLFGFLLTLPFSSGFDKLNDLQRTTLVVAFFTTAAAVISLLTPTAFHRIRWRQHDKEALLRWSNRLALLGLSCLAASTCSVVLLFSELFFSGRVAVAITTVAVLGVGSLWFALPLSRRIRSDRR
jgi:amino acid transporter